MKSSRRLVLRRETLTELTADELSRARGAALPTQQPGCSLDDVDDHVRDILLRYTLNQHCSWSCP